MTTIWATARPTLYRSLINRIPQRCLSNVSPHLPTRVGSGRYEAGDRVLLTYKEGRRIKTKLLSPLKQEGKSLIGASNAVVKHQDIIGKPSQRLYVDAVSGNGRQFSFRISHPSLEQFVSLAPRTVTPIYASYSAFMTNLLDIHVEPPCKDNDPQTSGLPPLEILEAGTGHGSLTLHLARAVAAANPSPPAFQNTSDAEEAAQIWDQWKASRRAILHTVEYKASRSKEAESGIRSFRGGLYWPHIDFHSGDAGAWAVDESRTRASMDGMTAEFLDVVCLDMPAAHNQIEHVYKAMKNHAQLLIYVPQITQLAACQQEIDRLQLPLKLDQAIELGEGISNGRVWDLRFVRPRKEQSDETVGEASESEDVLGVNTAEMKETEAIAESTDSLPAVDDDSKSVTSRDAVGFPTMVCRPMVGRLIMGGAFVGLWRKFVKH